MKPNGDHDAERTQANSNIQDPCRKHGGKQDWKICADNLYPKKKVGSNNKRKSYSCDVSKNKVKDKGVDKGVMSAKTKRKTKARQREVGQRKFLDREIQRHI